MESKPEATEKKWRPLERMFNEVPVKYDILNRIITWGQDQRWRKFAASECLDGNPEKVLDLCTGTGDLAIRMSRESKGLSVIHAVDYSEPMLAIARRKAARKGLDSIVFTKGDAAHLPYQPGSLDAVGIAFAFRNLTYKNPDREKFLAEIYRVLRKHGKLIIIESSQPGNRLYSGLFRIYLKTVVERLAGMISGHREAYRYLAASSRNFFNPHELEELLKNAGFTGISHRALMGGVAGLTVAIK